MADERNSWRPNRQHRRHTYYKVQIFDEVSLTWMDEKLAFDALEAARDRLAELTDKKARIMAVEGNARRPIE